MKKLLFLFLGVFLLVGCATQGPQNDEYFLYKLTSTDGGSTYTRTQLANIAYSAGTDTTEAIYIGGHTNFYVTVGARDSTSLLITFQTSMDGATWSATTTQDSLKNSTAAVVMATKSVNLTTVTLGVPFVRFLFVHSANAYPLGTTSAYYYAKVKLTQ